MSDECVTDLFGNEYTLTIDSSCSCGHARADHSSDLYDLNLELGHCLVDGCSCGRYE